MDAAQPLFCDRCTKVLTPGEGNFYVVRIEAVADPTPPQPTTEDFERDFESEIKAAIAEASRLSERELMDHVHRRVTLSLCRSCFEVWIEDPAGRAE